jgi:hypothetical protein
VGWDIVVVGDLVTLHIVLWHLKATFTLVFLNKFVILRMCFEVKVKVAHFLLLSVLVGGVACFVLFSI